jgi:hypothetical protein
VWNIVCHNIDLIAATPSRLITILYIPRAYNDWQKPSNSLTIAFPAAYSK